MRSGSLIAAVLAALACQALAQTQRPVCEPGPTSGPSCTGVQTVSFVPGDATAAIQAALDGDACTVVIPNVGQPWLTGPLFINRDDVTLVFEPGVELVARVGAFSRRGDDLIRVIQARGVTICGYGATIRMQNGVDAAYLDGEWRHAIDLVAAQDITIQGLTITLAGGDGIYVAGNWLRAPDHVPSRNVSIRDCTFVDNRRQGISVISVDGLLVENCHFEDIGATWGTDPMSGIDFEPDQADEWIVGCVARDCTFVNNRGQQYSSGVHMYLRNLGPDAPPVDVLLDRVRITNTATGGTGVALSGFGDVGPKTTIEIRDSVIEQVRGIGVYIFSAPSTTSVKLTRTVLRDTHTDDAPWGGAPIYIEGQSPAFSEYGGITFEDVVIVDNKPRPFIRVYEDRDHIPLPPTRCNGLAGTITIVNPHPEGHAFDLGFANDVNVDLEVASYFPGDAWFQRAR